MSDFEQSHDDLAQSESVEPPVGEHVTSVIDAGPRPAPEWLDEVEGELGDVDLVLKCLARNSTTRCATCDGLAVDGNLAGRAVLARCARDKEAR